MGLIDWRILVVVALIGVIVLAIGVRGKRVDGRPRCRRRRCRYELTSFLGESRPGSGYPATCPECARVAKSEREVRWGKRHARRWAMIVGAALLALAATPVGIEVHAKATSGNPLALMPLWLIANRAEHDTLANSFVHQRELLRRAETKEITGSSASRLIDRILRWQKNEAIVWGVLGDVFASLAAQGEATDEDVKEFWAHIIIPRVHVRDVVEVGQPIAWMVETHWRGHDSNLALRAQRLSLALPSEPQSPLPDSIMMSLLDSTLSVSINDRSIRWWDEDETAPIRPGLPDWPSLRTEYYPHYGFWPTRKVRHSVLASTDISVMHVEIRGSLNVPNVERALRAGQTRFLQPPIQVIVNHHLRHVWEFEAAVTVRVVEPGGIPSDPALNAFVQSAPPFVVRLSPIRVPHGQHLMIHVPIGAAPPPGALAARVILLRGSEEQFIGNILIPEGPRRWPMDAGGSVLIPPLLDDWFLPDAPKVEVVLRCDDAAVRRSPRLNRWEGEIVVPITDMRNIQGPGQAPPAP